MKKSTKQEIMMMANEIRKATGLSRSFSLKKAWQLQGLIYRLQQGPVSFSYYMVDGMPRCTVGTLKGGKYLRHANGKKSYRTLCYYDLNALDIRSFRIENLITIF